MISFRYHLVSLVAVFLALAVGVVVGTTALSGPITKDLRNQVAAAKKQRNALTTQVADLHNQVGDAAQFASTYGAKLVAGQLSDKSVLVLDLPGVSSAMSDGVDRELTAAGAKIAGHLAVQQDYLEASQGNGINSLATGPAHPLGLTLPRTSDAGQLGGALLAYVLLGKGEQTDLTQVLGGFEQLHMIQVTGGPVTPATNVVVVTQGTRQHNDYGGTAELALADALAHGGGHVVVAGDPASARKAGLVALVRNSGAARTSVATVDNANNAFGQVSSVLALADAIKGQVGQYGTGQGADALFPQPGS